MIFFTSCDKDHLFDCLKNTGSMTSEKRSSGEFNRIDVYNNPEVIIAQDVENSITVQAGDHVISGITTEISGGVLTIRNENKCNWVRSYAKTIAVYVHVKNLRIIHHHGSSTISSANQLQSTAFDLNVWNSGDINLSVKADSVYSRQHTTVGDITLSGETKYCFLYNNGNGFSYQSSLVADDEVIVQRGTGDCMVNVNQQLNVEIHDSGNVYYSGNPRVTSSITGVGRLIHQ
ncbi:MAG: DUF2807 domain-containing protein [Bacteroidetes bacterium]|nr:DUF2807 domain-containing protein [Bacteroidota bacterium]